MWEMNILHQNPHSFLYYCLLMILYSIPDNATIADRKASGGQAALLLCYHLPGSVHVHTVCVSAECAASGKCYHILNRQTHHILASWDSDFWSSLTKFSLNFACTIFNIILGTCLATPKVCHLYLGWSCLDMSFIITRTSWDMGSCGVIMKVLCRFYWTCKVCDTAIRLLGYHSGGRYQMVRSRLYKLCSVAEYVRFSLVFNVAEIVRCKLSGCEAVWARNAKV